MGQAIKRVKSLPSLPVGGTVRVVKGRPTPTTSLIKVITVINQGVIIVIIVIIIVVVIFTVIISIVHLGSIVCGVVLDPISHYSVMTDFYSKGGLSCMCMHLALKSYLRAFASVVSLGWDVLPWPSLLC